MKAKIFIIASACMLLACSLPSFAQVQALKWSVAEDYGDTIKGYPVENMMDGNPATAWAGSLDYVEEDGTKTYDDSKIYGDVIYGFKIKVEGSFVNSLAIVAGYAKSSSTYHNNSVPTQIAIYDGRCRINDGGEFVAIDGEIAKPVANASLKRTMDPQLVKFTSALETDSLWFVILDVVQGAKYNDLCISDITFYGR